jgi:hypothetical protein
VTRFDEYRRSEREEETGDGEKGNKTHSKGKKDKKTRQLTW